MHHGVALAHVEEKPPVNHFEKFQGPPIVGSINHGGPNYGTTDLALGQIREHPLLPSGIARGARAGAQLTGSSMEPGPWLSRRRTRRNSPRGLALGRARPPAQAKKNIVRGETSLYTHLQTMVDKIRRKAPTWFTHLINRSERFTHLTNRSEILGTFILGTFFF
jgi:hypothetical protein